MTDFILLDGDQVTFLPTFGSAVVVPAPGTLQGSGPSTFGGRKVCVDGDEKQVQVPGCAYTSGAFTTAGLGTLKITALSPDQKAQKTQDHGKQVLLQGTQFTAEFNVTGPATYTD